MSVRLVLKSVWNNPGNRGKRLSKTFGALRWQIEKRTTRASRILTLANNARFKAYPDCVISSALIYADWPEYSELMFLRRLLRGGDVVIDVGANVGHISILLADVVGPDNVTAFEPTPVSYRRLAENWRLNGWATAGLHQVAVGREHGKVRMPDRDTPLTTNAIVEESGDSTPTFDALLVPLDDLRHLWAQRTIGLLKFDVEGYEAEAFKGARRLIELDRPRCIMFESLSGSLDREIGELLAAAGYEIFQLDRDGAPDFTGCSAQNLFAVPSHLKDEVLARR